MIIKELEPFPPEQDKYRIAGRKAEEQMSFYLRRYFKSANNIFVINGLNLHKSDESAQIDHLIVHPNGFIIIESKSVAEKIIIAEDGQWIREFKGVQSGIQSPLIQAKLQAIVLSNLIKSINLEPIKNLSKKIDCLVSISDGGKICWPATGVSPGVFKADQICEKILEIVLEGHSDSDSFLSDAEIFKKVDPTIYSLDKVVPKSNWALAIACFLVDCTSNRHLIAQEVSEFDPQEEAEYYKLIFNGNIEALLGATKNEVDNNIQERLRKLRLMRQPLTKTQIDFALKKSI